MAFLNEYISSKDKEKYNLNELNKRMGQNYTGASDQWTIDRERNIWLRSFAKHMDHTDYGTSPGEDWGFYWQGTLLIAVVQLLETGGEYGGHCSSRKKLSKLDIPSQLKNQRTQILKDLEEAFAAYKDGGVYAHATSYDLIFEIAEGI